MKEDDKLCFLVCWEDRNAGLMRNFQLYYYPHEKSVEMFDLKTKNAIHNKKLKYLCKICGETDREKMVSKGHGRKSFSTCKSCANKATIARGRQQKIDLVNHMGGECMDCGYNKNYAAFDFHHLDI